MAKQLRVPIDSPAELVKLLKRLEVVIEDLAPVNNAPAIARAIVKELAEMTFAGRP